MDTCFLFTKHLNDQGCLSVKLSQDGQLIAPLEQRNFEQIQSLQPGSKTYIVDTAIHASLLPLDLPWLAERKARTAIPYALEDKLAQPLEELHFAFDKHRYQNNHYTITVIASARMRYLMQTLAQHNIDYDLITLDWFALEPGELIYSEDILLVHQTDYKGALTQELADSYLKKNSLEEPKYFKDSAISNEENHTEDSRTFIARRLLQNSPQNLCQAEYQRGNTSQWLKNGIQIVGALCGAWLLSILVVNALSMYLLNRKIDGLDEQIAVIYHEFFPQSSQVISPKFRIMQLLGNNSSDKQKRFWFLLNQVALVSKNKSIKIEQFRYQNQSLTLTIVSPDFSSLEKFENSLKGAQLKVHQVQAANREQQVVATLEIT